MDPPLQEVMMWVLKGVEVEAKWCSKFSKLVAEEFQIHQWYICCGIMSPTKEMGGRTMTIITKVVAQQ